MQINLAFGLNDHIKKCRYLFLPAGGDFVRQRHLKAAFGSYLLIKKLMKLLLVFNSICFVCCVSLYAQGRRGCGDFFLLLGGAFISCVHEIIAISYESEARSQFSAVPEWNCDIVVRVQLMIIIWTRR